MRISSVAKLIACSRENNITGVSESGPLPAICTILLPETEKEAGCGK